MNNHVSPSQPLKNQQQVKWRSVLIKAFMCPCGGVGSEQKHKHDNVTPLKT